MKRIKMIWDFRGPTAKQIANHHVIHLKDYVQTHKLSNTLADFTEVNEMYTMAYLVVDESDMLITRNQLKPHRGQLYIDN
ncbi:hypothetical protein NBT05_15910 [Aquimarina sp. ERC-38]|uniref:hypothetical protein n=1 Tax=Aquimarina sp. ERC-38 TaxID=2949996 RepID=UPI0022459D6D|nr:hypothetical protein [Aquimarina sp. ERC-38]UZO80425.1 hypothetical protein NBT05_15910 [Aquimarina sp. ERC-38]